MQELKDRQYRLNVELEEYTKADHQYHIHVGTVLDLSRRVGEIFESSEIEEKRAILNFLLQNPTVDGKKLEFTLKKPFDTVLELAHHPTRLREHYLHIPLLFNREYMSCITQQWCLIKLMERQVNA